MGESELSGVCFRFGSDLSLVAYQKKLYSLADFLHYCPTVHGVADVELANHQLNPKTYPTDPQLSILQTFSQFYSYVYIYIGIYNT